MIEYDFLPWNYTSFPSSLKLVNYKRDAYFWVKAPEKIPVKPGKVIIEFNAKISNVAGEVPRGSIYRLSGYSPAGLRTLKDVHIGIGTADWRKFREEITIPADIYAIEGYPSCGWASDEPAITWFDDLKIYMDDELIYDNYFTALRPGKVVPVVWTPPERIIGAIQRLKQGEKALIFKPPRLLQTVKV